MKKALKIPNVPFWAVLDYSSLLIWAFRGPYPSAAGRMERGAAGRLLIAINPSPGVLSLPRGFELGKARGTRGDALATRRSKRHAQGQPRTDAAGVQSFHARSLRLWFAGRAGPQT